MVAQELAATDNELGLSQRAGVAELTQVTQRAKRVCVDRRGFAHERDSVD